MNSGKVISKGHTAVSVAIATLEMCLSGSIPLNDKISCCCPKVLSTSNGHKSQACIPSGTNQTTNDSLDAY